MSFSFYGAFVDNDLKIKLNFGMLNNALLNGTVDQENLRTELDKILELRNIPKPNFGILFLVFCNLEDLQLSY
jgi:hypothetical protein